MINFKIDVFLGLEDCRKTHFNRVGYFYDVATFERYKVFIDNVELTDGGYTFYKDFEENSTISLKIVDLTNELADYEQSIQLYDKDVWMDIILLYNREDVGVSNYNCFLGVNGENQNEYNNEGDFLGGSNYFEWEITYYNSLNVLVSEVIRVKRPRDVNDILIPYNNSIAEWQQISNQTGLTEVTRKVSIYLSTIPSFIQELADEAGTYIELTEVNVPEGRYLYKLSLDFSEEYGNAFFYTVYRLQTEQVIGDGCCGNTTTSFEDCEYPFEVTNTNTRNRDYCNSEVSIIDIPCSRNKYLYKNSTSIYPIKVEVNCDGQWKSLGIINDVLLLNVEQSTIICNKDTFNLRTSCISEYSDCCGNNHTTANECVNLYTINTLPQCPTGELLLSQSICKDTLDCDECGGIEGRYITNQKLEINTLVNWANIDSWYYHNENIVEAVPFENTLTYFIEKEQKDKSFLNIFTSNIIDLSENSSLIEYTFTESGIYKIKVIITNQCKSVELERVVYVYSKNVIERLDCNNYRLLHCIDKDFDLIITDYNTKELVYKYDAQNLKEVYYTDGVKVKYNEDYYAYDITFTKDDIYRLDYNNNTFIILHDCFITNCHQEYIKSLLCEGDICNVLLDRCMVTDTTMLKVYMIQKYVLLYDVYKSLASKIVNIEYAHIINPTVILEDNSCIDLYNLWDIIQKLKEMCVKCGFNITETDDCGCN